MNHLVEKYGENVTSDKVLVLAGFINTKPDPIDNRYTISDKVYVEVDIDADNFNDKVDNIVSELSQLYSDFKQNKKLQYEYTIAATSAEREIKSNESALHHKQMQEKYPQYFINGHIYFSGKKMRDSFELESAINIEKKDRQNEWNIGDSL